MDIASEIILMYGERLEEVIRQRDELAAALLELLKAMRDYEIDINDEPPYKHIKMMKRARQALAELPDPPTPEPRHTEPIE